MGETVLSMTSIKVLALALAVYNNSLLVDQNKVEYVTLLMPLVLSDGGY